MNRPDLSCITPEQAAYIEFLEGQLNGSSNLIKELNLLADLYAKDLMLIRTGKDGPEGQNLTFMKEGKTFERSLVLVDKAKIFAELAKLSRPPEAKAVKEPGSVSDTPEEQPKKRRNIQDFVLANKQ